MTRIFTFFCAFMLFSLPAFACSCVQEAYSQDGSQRNIQNAELILSGDIVNSNAPRNDQYKSSVTIDIKDIYKGAYDKDRITVGADTQTSCGYSLDHYETLDVLLIYKFDQEYQLAAQCSDYISDQDKSDLKEGMYLESGMAGATDDHAPENENNENIDDDDSVIVHPAPPKPTPPVKKGFFEKLWEFLGF